MLQKAECQEYKEVEDTFTVLVSPLKPKQANPLSRTNSSIMPQTRIVDGALEGASLTRAQFIFSFSLVTCLFFLWGLSYGLVDSLNAHVQTVFNVSKAASTGLQAAYFGKRL